MASEERDLAVHRLEDALTEQDRLGERFDAALGVGRARSLRAASGGGRSGRGAGAWLRGWTTRAIETNSIQPKPAQSPRRVRTREHGERR